MSGAATSETGEDVPCTGSSEGGSLFGEAGGDVHDREPDGLEEGLLDDVSQDDFEDGLLNVASQSDSIPDAVQTVAYCFENLRHSILPTSNIRKAEVLAMLMTFVTSENLEWSGLDNLLQMMKEYAEWRCFPIRSICFESCWTQSWSARHTITVSSTKAFY